MKKRNSHVSNVLTTKDLEQLAAILDEKFKNYSDQMDEHIRDLFKTMKDLERNSLIVEDLEEH